MEKNDKNIVIVCHRNLPQPDDDLVLYLNQRKYNTVLHIKHSFSDAQDRCSYYFLYKNGKLLKKERTRDFKFLPEPLIYLKELFFTLKWLRSKNWDLYIGMDGLCWWFGYLLVLLKRVKKTVYWVMDLVPEKRFTAGHKNKVYNFVNVFATKHTDQVWDDLGEQRIVTREKVFGIKRTDYKGHAVVPFGAWLDRIHQIPYGKSQKYTAVFMGHLIEKQGVQYVIQAMPKILKKIPDFQFKIIGDGRYKKELMDLAKKMKVEKHCKFLGKIEDNEKMEKEIAKSALAVAPYVKTLDTFSYYGDNGKMKVYLGCGVPVLVTNVSWLAKEVEKNNCGKIIKEDIDDITKSIVLLMSPKLNNSMRKNAIAYAKTFDYQTIFPKLIYESF